MRSSPCLIALSAVLGLGTLTSPGAAQPQIEKAPFYQSGPWTVIEQPSARTCELTMSGLPDGELEVSKAESEPAFFEYKPNEELEYNAPSTGVEWRFDDVVINGTLLVGRIYQIKDDDWRTRAQSAQAEDRFRRAERLILSQNGKVLLDADLAGSLRAFDQLRRCAAQWPEAELLFAPPPPPPPPPPRLRPQSTVPDTSGSLPANRELEPIDSQSWIKPRDYPVMSGNLFRTEGQVGFNVLVNQRGRVESCEISSSSGSGPVDQLTCRLITHRARFHPQTDKSGNPVPAQFSSEFVWKLPE